MLQQQQKDLKEGGVLVNDLKLQVGDLKNVLANKVRTGSRLENEPHEGIADELIDVVMTLP